MVIYCNNWSILNVIFCHLFLLLKTHPHVIFYQHILIGFLQTWCFYLVVPESIKISRFDIKTCISVCGMTSWYSKEAQKSLRKCNYTTRHEDLYSSITTTMLLQKRIMNLAPKVFLLIIIHQMHTTSSNQKSNGI